MRRIAGHFLWAGVSVLAAICLGGIALWRGEPINSMWLVVAAVCTYLLVLIAIKHHRLPVSPQIFLHLIETNIFEKITLDQLVANAVLNECKPDMGKQLILL